jgi:phosphoribosylaminoimidazole-succinocarboxamide synthase
VTFALLWKKVTAGREVSTCDESRYFSLNEVKIEVRKNEKRWGVKSPHLNNF